LYVRRDEIKDLGRKLARLAHGGESLWTMYDHFGGTGDFSSFQGEVRPGSVY